MSSREVRSDPAPPAPVVRLVRARVRLAGVDALAGVDVDVQAGALTVLTGSNGAGKSTLLEVMAGVRPLTTGRVERSAASAALVPQRTAVPDRLPVTVRDVVTMGVWGRVGLWRRVGRPDGQRVQAALDLLGLSDLARRPFSALSGGQRQRTLLAQGIARGADLLLLDEPTTGLDDVSCQSIVSAIEAEVARGVAVVCATHDVGVAVVADRVVHLHEGRVREPRTTEVGERPDYS